MSLTVTVQKGHDFSSGNITRAALNAGAVPTVAVTGSVSTTEMIDGAVTADKLAADAVSNVKIENLAVTEAKLGAASVGLGKLGAASVVASNLLVLKNATLPDNANIIDGLTEITGDVAVDDYLIVHNTSASTTGDRQLFKAKVSAVQKVGTTEYVMAAAISAGATATGGPVITNPSTSTPSVQVDLDGAPFQTIELIGGKTYTFAALDGQSADAVKTVTLRVKQTGTGAATFELTGTAFNAWGWPERENGAPSSIAEGKTALLSLTSFGPGDANVIAAYAVTI